jgi:Parvulin-like peptidyl-prolyl isomerase
MKKFIQKCFFILFVYTYFSYSSYSLDKMSGIYAIIGNDIILDSEMKDNKKYFCNTDYINDVIIQKLMYYYAKKDKSIQISDQELELRTQTFLSEMKKKYINKEEFLVQFNNKNFLKELNKKIKTQQYIEKYYNKITENVEASPEEVKSFFKENKIPYKPKKICLSYIIFHPKYNKINRKKTIDFLNKIRKEIHSDTDFSVKAILFSEDKSSALQGGIIKNIKINNLSKEFIHSILSLKKGEISEPVETNLGFHLIKLDKKSKDEIDFRHILIKHKYSKYELNKTKSFANLFRKHIVNHKMNIDKKIPDFLIKNYQIADITVQNKIWIEENQLSKNMKKILTFLKKGSITNPYKEIINGKEVFVIYQLLDEIPSKPISFEEDYSILKNIVIDIKKKDKIKNWAKEILKKTFFVKTNC